MTGIKDHGIGISSVFRDQGSGCTIFVGSGRKIGKAFGVKDQKLAKKVGSAMKKHTSLPACA